MFFDDRLAMPGVYGGSVGEAVRYGARPVKLDLGMILGVLAQATSRIGLGATYSTTYYPPFHVARTFASLDHLAGGRAAWNVGTSVNDSEAQNFGVDAHLGHDERYDRADEFMDVVTGLWDTLGGRRRAARRVSGRYANPAKVHELSHVGEFFSACGPLTVPRTPQGQPVIIQAGSSGRGREFASRWAELIFAGDPGIDVARSHYADQKDRIADAGRDPAAVRICPMAYAVVGESEAYAKDREAMLLNDLVHPMASLTLLSELMNYDFAQHDLDDPVTDDILASVSGIRGLVQNLRAHIGGDAVTVRDLANHRATLLQGPRFVGTGPQVADQMALVPNRRLLRIRAGRNASARRIQRRGAHGGSRVATPRPVPHRIPVRDPARASRAAAPRQRPGGPCLTGYGCSTWPRWPPRRWWRPIWASSAPT